MAADGPCLLFMRSEHESILSSLTTYEIMMALFCSIRSLKTGVRLFAGWLRLMLVLLLLLVGVSRLLVGGWF
jgi:hypothetical protein